MVILRFIHIFSSIFWVGTTLFMVLFLEPTVRSLGPDGGKFMQRLLGGTRFSLVIALSAWITIIAGALLYWPLTGWSPQVMFGSRLPLTLGALAGIAGGRPRRPSSALRLDQGLGRSRIASGNWTP